MNHENVYRLNQSLHDKALRDAQAARELKVSRAQKEIWEAERSLVLEKFRQDPLYAELEAYRNQVNRLADNKERIRLARVQLLDQANQEIRAAVQQLNARAQDRSESAPVDRVAQAAKADQPPIHPHDPTAAFEQARRRADQECVGEG